MTYLQFVSNRTKSVKARIAFVEPDSPAERAGLKPGMSVLAVDGEPLRDILDWQWCADGYEVELELASCDVHLTRNPGEAWGIEFSEALFDGLRRCANKCIFCFMKMLPKGMRSSLYVRDDDYRLSFLHGNFVTLTNLTDEDVERIIALHLSPLNVSLHAVRPAVRERLMGKNHARGIEVLQQLLEAGIECKAQIVLMPNINDGAVLDETLAWIAERPGIMATGIVPYGYTRYAAVQQGFDTPESARAVIRQVEQLAPQVQLADEFYLKAWPGEALAHLPAAGYYGDFPLIEDGIGMVRQFVDCYANDDASFWNAGTDATGADTAVAGTTEAGTTEADILVTGTAFASVLCELFPARRAHIFPIENTFFGGNVDVAGLLTAGDIISQIGTAGSSIQRRRYLLPSVMFNDDGLTLDNKTAADIAQALRAEVCVLP